MELLDDLMSDKDGSAQVLSMNASRTAAQDSQALKEQQVKPVKTLWIVPLTSWHNPNCRTK